MFLQGRVLLSNSSKKTLTSLTFIDENFREVKFLNRRKQIEKNYAPGEYVKLVKEFRQAVQTIDENTYILSFVIYGYFIQA